MAIPTRFLRVSLVLVCLFGLNLIGPLLNSAQAASPVPSNSSITGSLAVQMSALAPCTSAARDTVPAKLPAAIAVTPVNNPDPTASAPGDALSSLQNKLNSLVQSELNNGLSAVSVI